MVCASVLLGDNPLAKFRRLSCRKDAQAMLLRAHIAFGEHKQHCVYLAYRHDTTTDEANRHVLNTSKY